MMHDELTSEVNYDRAIAKLEAQGKKPCAVCLEIKELHQLSRLGMCDRCKVKNCCLECGTEITLSKFTSIHIGHCPECDNIQVFDIFHGWKPLEQHINNQPVAV